jgi:hypothetical protein
MSACQHVSFSAFDLVISACQHVSFSAFGLVLSAFDPLISAFQRFEWTPTLDFRL